LKKGKFAGRRKNKQTGERPKEEASDAAFFGKSKWKGRKRRFAVEHAYPAKEDDFRPDRRQVHHPQDPFFLVKLRLDERLLMQRWEDAEDEKLMRLFEKQLVLTFGDFCQLYNWRGRTLTKGKGKRRQKARRFKVLVIKGVDEHEEVLQLPRRFGD